MSVTTQRIAVVQPTINLIIPHTKYKRMKEVREDLKSFVALGRDYAIGFIRCGKIEAASDAPTLDEIESSGGIVRVFTLQGKRRIHRFTFTLPPPSSTD